MPGPLDGLRVVSFSTTLAGMHVGQFFADFGGDVTGIEPPGGSPMRSERSWPFLARGQRSVVADLRDAAGLERAKRLVVEADVMVETWRPGVAERLGLGYSELSEQNQRLVVARITGFGRRGPYADRKGYEGLVMARAGAMTQFSNIKARPGPGFVAVPFAAFSAAQLANQGILSALLEREESGRGQCVDTSLLHGFALHDNWNWLVRLVAARFPGAFSSAPPIGQDGVPNSSIAFRLLPGLTADGRWLQFSQTAPRLFQAFMRVLGLDWMFADPEWKTAPDFDDHDQRRRYWEYLLEAVRSKSLAEWQEIFDREPDVWAEVFRHGSELLDHPQMVHDRQVVTLDDPAAGPVRQPGPMIRLDRTPGSADRPAPVLDSEAGEQHHTTKPTCLESASAAPVGLLPLAGVTVVEFGTYFAAPFGATLLTDLGARVIKVEELSGEPMRSILGFPEIGGVKVLQGKQSVAVDITAPAGRRVALDLVRRADLVLLSFRAGVAERLGLDPASLHRVAPDAMVLQSPGYGADGPCGHRPAYAPTIGAGTGMAMQMLGMSAREGPDLDMDELKQNSNFVGRSTTGPAQADALSAVGVGTALMLGLWAARHGAPGQSMLTSMLLTTSHALSESAVEHTGSPSRQPDSDLYGFGPLYRLYEAAEGTWLFLAAPAEREWRPLVELMRDEVDLAGDRRFDTSAGRERHAGDLATSLAAAFARRSSAEWEKRAAQADVGIVALPAELSEVVLYDEVLGRPSGLVVDVEHPTIGPYPRLTPAVRFSRSATRALPPELTGQSTKRVLREDLGYSDEEIADLLQAGVIAT